MHTQPDWLHILASNPDAFITWLDEPDPLPTIRNRRIQTPDATAGRWIARRLRAQPHRWAVIYDGHPKWASDLAKHINDGHCGFTYAGHFQARYANGVVYTRYLGPHRRST